MRLSIDVTMHYQFTEPNTLCLALEAAEVAGQNVVEDSFDLGDAELHRIKGDCGIGDRVWARLQRPEMKLRYRATVDVLRPADPIDGLEAMPLHLISSGAAPYLRPSRYCQSDKFTAFVKKRFGHLQGGRKVQAIRDWIEAELSYVPGSSDSDTHVLETFAGREGVCRDYVHLFCAMVRAAQIPARAVAAYSPGVTPPDFHAVAEVWLDGVWHLVDATGMGTPEDLVVIAVGRDAYDIAFMESEAPASLIEQRVSVTRD